MEAVEFVYTVLVKIIVVLVKATKSANTINTSVVARRVVEVTYANPPGANPEQTINSTNTATSATSISTPTLKSPKTIAPKKKP